MEGLENLKNWGSKPLQISGLGYGFQDFLVFIINFGPNSYPLKGNYPLAVRNISAVYPYIRFFISEELACCKGPGR